MRRAATLSLVAILLTGAPTLAEAQTPPPTRSDASISSHLDDLINRLKANEQARADAAAKCDLNELGLLHARLYALLTEAETLMKESQLAKTPGLYKRAKTTYEGAEGSRRSSAATLRALEKECREKAGGESGVGAVQSTTPAVPADAQKPKSLQELEGLYAEAMTAYGAHTQAAANCDQNGMRSQRSKLEIFNRDARRRASKLRQNAFGSSSPGRKALADQATAIEKAIEMLWQQALAMPPMNCPKTGVVGQPGQPQQEVPDEPEQQQQQEVAPPEPPPPTPAGALPPPVPPYRTAPPPRTPAGEQPPPPPPADAKPPPEPPQVPQVQSEAIDQLNQLLAQAQQAFAAHTQAVVECDLEAMRALRAKLELYSRAARASASKLRQRAAKQPNNFDRGQLASAATRFEKEIEALWQQALAQQPENCPKPPPDEQQIQQEVPTPPSFGARFTPPNQQSQRFLLRINYWRSDAGMTALKWDRDLAVSAQSRGVELTQTGLAHRPRTGPRPVGENLLQSLPGQRSIEQMIDVWGNEKRYFVPGIFPNISTTGDWAAAGHYSQMVWGGSQWVGCAVSTGGGYDWTICHFYPVGNKDGKSVLGPPPRDLIPFIRPTVIDIPESP